MTIAMALTGVSAIFGNSLQNENNPLLSIPDLVVGMTVSEMLSRGLLWQDIDETIPAVSHSDPVRVAYCQTTGVRMYAASDTARPILTSLGNGKWGLKGNGLNQRLFVGSINLVMPYSMAAGYIWNSSGVGRLVSSTINNRIFGTYGFDPPNNGNGAFFLGSFVNSGSGRDNDPHVVVGTSTTGESRVYLDGADVTVASNHWNDWGNITLLGSYDFNDSEYSDAILTSFIITSSVMLPSDKLIVESYISSYLP